MRAPNRSLHIVQVGFDDTLFMPNAPSDTLARQLRYGRELDRRCPGSRMSVVMLTNSAAAQRFERENVTFVPVVASRLRRPIGLYRQLSTLHREQPLDVISTQTIHLEAWTALWFARRHGANVIGQVHYDLFSPIAQRDVLGQGLRGRAYYLISLWMLRHMFAVRVVGRRVREQLLAKGLHRNVCVIPVPVTMGPCTAADPAPAPNNCVLFVGRLDFPKNVEEWLTIAQRLAAQAPDAVFEIVGDGPLRETLESQAHQLGLAPRVHFAGTVPYDRLPDIYRTAKVFLLTSRYEGFGRVVAEACLNGVPVVATRITGVEDIVDDGETGFLHAAGDVEGMAKSALRLLRDDSLRQTMGQLGRERVRARFDPDRLTREWVDLLVSAAEGTTS